MMLCIQFLIHRVQETEVIKIKKLKKFLHHQLLLLELTSRNTIIISGATNK